MDHTQFPVRVSGTQGAQPSPGNGQDPVLAKRAAIARWVSIGQRVGYALFGVACVAFVVGFAVGFEAWVTTSITIAIVVGSLILAPAIVFGYGVKSADRADREGTWGDPNP